MDGATGPCVIAGHGPGIGTAVARAFGRAGLKSRADRTGRGETGGRGVGVGMVTVMGIVRPGTRFGPGAIADAFVALHHGAAGPATAAVRFA